MEIRQVNLLIAESIQAPSALTVARVALDGYLNSLGVLASLPDPVVLIATGQEVTVRQACDAWFAVISAFVSGYHSGAVEPLIVNAGMAALARVHNIPYTVTSNVAVLASPTAVVGGMWTYLVDRRVAFDGGLVDTLQAVLCQSDLILPGSLLAAIKDAIC